MAENSSSSSSVGIGFTGILTIIFVIFKLLGKITWSWWWVFSPIIISWGIVLFIVAAIAVIAIVAALVAD